MPIRILSREVSAQIAAGEVIERPASVVKELVENSLDAGATQVEVEVRGGGVKLIRVTDDGCGIPAEELSIAFERHATSKISSVEDLSHIGTLGFRGEALPSVAAVASVTLVSHPPDAVGGAYITLQNGQEAEEGKQGAAPGTTVLVRDLFKSVPARLKFLKSASTENARILQVLSHYAIAYPETKFRLLLDGRLAFHSSGNGEPRDALVEVVGLETARALLEIGLVGSQGSVEVAGFVSPPDLTRSRRDAIATFVNRRWVQSRTLIYAVEEAYRDLLPRGQHPVAAVFIRLAPSEVDVNVHPAKAEVRFRREGEVFGAVQLAVRATLAAHSLVPLDAGPIANVLPAPPPPPRDAEVALEAPPLFLLTTVPALSREAPLPLLRPVGQVATTYIIAEGPDGMYLIDQHAAHERVVFEELQSARREKGVALQGLLNPLPATLTPLQAQALEAETEMLRLYGFQWEPFGERTVLLRSVPPSLREGEALQALLDALADAEDGRPVPLEERERRIAASVACHSSVRAGQVLTVKEMESLIRQLEAARFPRLCPHGRPTMVHLSSAQLDKQFGRR
ncbi:MAG: DNA mismatch repair endonuclease MutL [Chloroflexi bacterium]|nr:DNA mismatch repair endonuclease MutL [Chloroflexota bacterium]